MYEWTECALIAQNGYRLLIDEAPGYCLGRQGDVWRLPSVIAGKGGSTRLWKGQEITPDHGRVSLRHNGKTVRWSVNQLHRKYHPEQYAVDSKTLPRFVSSWMVGLVPTRLRWLDLLMRERPASVPWGAGDYSPGCHAPPRAEVFQRPTIQFARQHCPTDIARTSQGFPKDDIGQDRIGEERLARTATG